jgi:hypothetical protein
MPIAIREAAIGLIDPLSKLAVRTGGIDVVSVVICKFWFVENFKSAFN